MRLWRAVFALWVFFWIFFLARGFVKGECESFRSLFFLSAPEKRAHILGEELDRFLAQCLAEMPETATYKIAGDLDDHNKYRIAYYLYPRTRAERPDYILWISKGESRYNLKRVR